MGGGRVWEGGGGFGLGGQGGCEWRSEAFVKIQKKKKKKILVWGGGQGGWERRIEAFVKIQKKNFFFGGGGGGGGGVGSGGGGGGRRDQGRRVMGSGWM